MRQVQQRPEDAVPLAMSAGEKMAVYGFGNPALVPWRTRAAESLRALGRTKEAIGLAEEEAGLARRWSSP